MHAMKRMCVWGLLLGSNMGCDAQADPEYQGEPLLRVSGKVVTGASAPSGELDAAIFWMRRLQANGEVASPATIARTRVRGSFPSTFTLDVMEPPPGVDDPKLADEPATGFIVAVPANSAAPTGPEPELLGGALGVGILYFNRDGEPGSTIDYTAQRYAVEPTKGFHIFRFKPIQKEAEAQYFRCISPTFLCERSVSRELSLVDQRFLDEDFARCLEYVPNAVTCTTYLPPQTEEEETETARCWELIAKVPSFDCPAPWEPESLDGVSEPLTVTLGVGWRALMSPRYRE